MLGTRTLFKGMYARTQSTSPVVGSVIGALARARFWATDVTFRAPEVWKNCQYVTPGPKLPTSIPVVEFTRQTPIESVTTVDEGGRLIGVTFIVTASVEGSARSMAPTGPDPAVANAAAIQQFSPEAAARARAERCEYPELNVVALLVCRLSAALNDLMMRLEGVPVYCS